MLPSLLLRYGIARRVCIVGWKRIKFRAIVITGVQDDGLQHLPLARDLDVVMVNVLTLWVREETPHGPLKSASTAATHAVSR